MFTIRTTLPALLCACCLTAAYQGLAADAPARAQPVFEHKDGWKFEDGELLFANECPNQGGVRFLKWKEYTWVVTADQIMVIDPRPYGVTLQGARHQKDVKGRVQGDKNLMEYLKDQAEEARENNEPETEEPRVHVGVAVGARFRF